MPRGLHAILQAMQLHDLETMNTFFVLHGLAFLTFLPVLIAVAAWTVVIKGFALWKAARSGDRTWFVILLVVNTIGILEVIYLTFFLKKQSPAETVAEVPSTD